MERLDIWNNYSLFFQNFFLLIYFLSFFIYFLFFYFLLFFFFSFIIIRNTELTRSSVDFERHTRDSTTMGDDVSPRTDTLYVSLPSPRTRSWPGLVDTSAQGFADSPALWRHRGSRTTPPWLYRSTTPFLLLLLPLSSRSSPPLTDPHDNARPLHPEGNVSYQTLRVHTQARTHTLVCTMGVGGGGGRGSWICNAW